MEPSSHTSEGNENAGMGKKAARCAKMLPENFRRFPNFPFLTLSNGYSFAEGSTADGSDSDNDGQDELNSCSTKKQSTVPFKSIYFPQFTSIKEIFFCFQPVPKKRQTKDLKPLENNNDHPAANHPISRDAQPAGSVTNYPQGYHIVWKSNIKGNDCLHDPDGHRYCYYVNEGSNYCKPTNREAFWQCSGRGVLTKRTCGVIVREVDGIFSQYSVKAHLAEPHLPKDTIFNNCPICVERNGLQ